jgi:hypothetical protein
MEILHSEGMYEYTHSEQNTPLVEQYYINLIFNDIPSPSPFTTIEEILLFKLSTPASCASTS